MDINQAWQRNFYMEGVKAALNGEGRDACDHIFGQAERELWCEGWEYANKKQEQLIQLLYASNGRPITIVLSQD